MFRAAMVALVAVIVLPLAVRAQSDSDMLEKALPGVVTVAVYKGDPMKTPYGFGADDAYQRVLDLSGAIGSGSGFVIEKAGKKYVVTNAHVIEHAADQEGAIAAFSINQTKYVMKVVGADSFFDIAVLEFVKAPGKEVTVMTLNPAEHRVGAKVFAIGNPLGLFAMSVSDGIIGGRNRTLDGLTAKYGYYQSTATVIWGNSGGPLVNDKGEVIGMNSRIQIKQQGDQSFIQPQINFALEGRIIQRALDDIVKHGRVQRSYFGLKLSEDRALVRRQNGTMVYGPVQPAIIAEVSADSPAAGVLGGRQGATITKINNVAVRNLEEILGELEQVLPGAEVSMEIVRGGKTEKVAFKTVELSRQRLATIGQEFMKSYRLDVESRDGRLVLKDVQVDQPDRFASLDYAAEAGRGFKNMLKGFRTPLPQPQPQPQEQAFPLVAAGIVDDQGQGTLWRVGDYADMGVICRLAAPAGRVDLAINRGEQKYHVVRVNLSGSQAKETRVVLY